ncbi:MAG: AAA family ATPase [Flavobacteriales bacterium]|jgi:cellulose biosynthesis protein BcsQ|nr:AAA family ATPase [Flavobacteriales bacterium]
MSVPVITFFNNKGGVGKTSLVYHVAWMLNNLGVRTLAVDLDPQANLTAAFMTDEALEEIWSDPPSTSTIYGCIEPLSSGTSDVQTPDLTEIAESLWLLNGDMRLSALEDELSSQWPDCMDRKVRAFRVISAISRVIQAGAKEVRAEVIIADVGPYLGALNRAAMVATDHVVVPLAADLFSMKGLENLGRTLRAWREQWQERLPRNPDATIPLPSGNMQPTGYVLMQHAVRLDRPVQAYQKWVDKAPAIYARYVLGTPEPVPGNDPNRIDMIKHYRSLMPMAQEARKPMFHLKPADGAIGGHVAAVQACYRDFDRLTREILKLTGLPEPTIPAT